MCRRCEIAIVTGARSTMRGHDERAQRSIVDDVAETLRGFRGCEHARVDRAIVGRGDHEPAAVELGFGEGFGAPARSRLRMRARPRTCVTVGLIDGHAWRRHEQLDVPCARPPGRRRRRGSASRSDGCKSPVVRCDSIPCGSLGGPMSVGAPRYASGQPPPKTVSFCAYSRLLLPIPCAKTLAKSAVDSPCNQWLYASSRSETP